MQILYVILDIIQKLGVPAMILFGVSLIIKKQDKEMLDKQENLEKYFKPLSLSYRFGEDFTQISDKDLNFYTLKPFQLILLQGDVKAFSIYTYDDQNFLHGGQPQVPSYEKIAYEQNSKENYGRRMNCLPEFIPDQVCKVNLLDKEDNIREIEMFAYYVAIEDYTGKYETFLVIYLMYSDNRSMLASYVVDKFSALLNLPFQFGIEKIRPTQEHQSRVYGKLSVFLANYKDFRQRVKDNF